MTKRPAVSELQYGQGDATFQAAGGLFGVRCLVDTFYDIMANEPEYKPIWELHPNDNIALRDKLTRFLCGWMGGPRLYLQKYGPINIPQVHKHLDIDSNLRDLWLSCMSRALKQQRYPQHLKDYLLRELTVPAELIRKTAQSRLVETST